MKYRIQQIPAGKIEETRAQLQFIRAETDTQIPDLNAQQAEYWVTAEAEGKQIGAAWAWNLDADDKPAEMYVYLQPEYRNCGIGTELVRTMTDALALTGYKEIMATVRRDNYAVLVFGKVGFKPVKEVDLVYTLRLDLAQVGQIEM